MSSPGHFWTRSVVMRDDQSHKLLTLAGLKLVDHYPNWEALENFYPRTISKPVLI